MLSDTFIDWCAALEAIVRRENIFLPRADENEVLWTSQGDGIQKKYQWLPLYLHSIFCLCKDLVPSGIFLTILPSKPPFFLNSLLSTFKILIFLVFRKIFFIPYILLNISIPFSVSLLITLNIWKELPKFSVSDSSPPHYSFIHCSLYLAPYSKENIFRKVTCFYYYLLLHACVYTHTHTKTLWLGQDIYGFSSYT